MICKDFEPTSNHKWASQNTSQAHVDKKCISPNQSKKKLTQMVPSAKTHSYNTSAKQFSPTPIRNIFESNTHPASNSESSLTHEFNQSCPHIFIENHIAEGGRRRKTKHMLTQNVMMGCASCLNLAVVVMRDNPSVITLKSSLRCLWPGKEETTRRALKTITKAAVMQVVSALDTPT